MHSFFFAFTFQIHIHIHIFTSEVTCYFCYRQIIFLLFYLFTFKRPFTFKLRPDAAVATSRRNLSYVPT